ncbi:MAG: class I SAM-dependent methyltransferase [Oscillospiraceae bacterium]|jgi:SAM-dependent methyltransferase|nr:class I SAM-dependent methyltransferase [Oscillospiraceae bacterium]
MLDHNTGDFSGKAEVYDQSRPPYPRALYDYLYSDVGFESNAVIADIGAGTGIFSAGLIERGSRVIAVEPDGGMRAQAVRRLGASPLFSAVGAGAENTGLSEESVDFITAAQAFHWFDRAAFSAECRRILKKGGRVALIWNDRDDASPIVTDIAEISAALCPRFRGFKGGFGKDDASVFSAFYNGPYEYRAFENDLMLGADVFIGRCLSSSYAPKPDEENYEAFAAGLRNIFTRYSQGSEILMPYITKCYTGAMI